MLFCPNSERHGLLRHTAIRTGGAGLHLALFSCAICPFVTLVSYAMKTAGTHYPDPNIKNKARERQEEKP
jgi:hypothetical protein